MAAAPARSCRACRGTRRLCLQTEDALAGDTAGSKAAESVFRHKANEKKKGRGGATMPAPDLIRGQTSQKVRGRPALSARWPALAESVSIAAR